MRLKSPSIMTVMMMIDLKIHLFIFLHFLREEQQEPMALTLSKPVEAEKQMEGLGEGVVNGIITTHLNSNVVSNHPTNMVLNSQPTNPTNLEMNQPTNLVTSNLVNGEGVLKQEVQEEVGTEVKQEEQVVEQVDTFFLNHS